MNGRWGHLPHPLRKWTQQVRMFLLFCFCVLGGEAGPGSAKNIWSPCPQRPLKLHPRQDPTRLLPLARARSLWGEEASTGSCKGKQNECSQMVDVYDQLWVHTQTHTRAHTQTNTHARTHTPPLPMPLTCTFSASALQSAQHLQEPAVSRRSIRALSPCKAPLLSKG